MQSGTVAAADDRRCRQAKSGERRQGKFRQPAHIAKGRHTHRTCPRRQQTVHHHQHNRQTAHLYQGGQPQSQDPPHGGAIRPHATELLARKPGEKQYAHTKARRLGDHRGPGRTGNAQVQPIDQQPIQQQVHPGRQQPDPKAVIHTPLRPYNRRKPGGKHIARCQNGKIGTGIRQNLCRGTKQPQQRRAKQQANAGNPQRCGVKKRHGAFCNPACCPVVLLSQTGRHQRPGTSANHLGNSTLQNRQGKDHTDTRSRQIAYPVADKQRVRHIIKGTKEQRSQSVRQVPQQTAGHRRSGQRLRLVLRLLAPALTHGAKWQRPPCKPKKHHLYPPSSPGSRA